MSQHSELGSSERRNSEPLIPAWQSAVGDQFKLPYMQNLREFLAGRLKEKKTIFPKKTDIFAALNQVPIENVKVVILGQDPYHGPGQAHGLSFSVPAGVRPPPSLINIYKELETDLGIPRTSHGSLIRWAEQGVLLLNSVLTVEQGQPGSHANRGWETFTDAVIQRLAKEKRPIVFILWGAYAQKKGAFLAKVSHHLVIKSAHPSPLSASNGFFGSKPFSTANAFLKAHDIQPIDWNLSVDA